MEKNAIENVYFFFTYERCRRRLSLIKMINEVQEVFVLLSPRRITNTCFGSTDLRVSKVRLFKDSIGLLAHDKKEGTRQMCYMLIIFIVVAAGYFLFPPSNPTARPSASSYPRFL